MMEADFKAMCCYLLNTLMDLWLFSFRMWQRMMLRVASLAFKIWCKQNYRTSGHPTQAYEKCQLYCIHSMSIKFKDCLETNQKTNQKVSIDSVKNELSLLQATSMGQAPKHQTLYFPFFHSQPGKQNIYLKTTSIGWCWILPLQTN